MRYTSKMPPISDTPFGIDKLKNLIKRSRHNFLFSLRGGFSESESGSNLSH